jgi:virulence factor Mce-like protein
VIGNRRHLLLGLLALGLMGVFAAFVGLRLAGSFGAATYTVTAKFDRAGQLLKTNSDVKLRGILVGKVVQVARTEGGGALITMNMFRSQQVPRNVTAAIRGKTLFGEKLVQFSVEQPSGETLQGGDQISQDRTTEPFELETVLETGMPVLRAIEPGRLGGAVHALAQGVVGQEEAARRSIDNGLIALRALNSRSADLDRLLAGLDEGADSFARASPSLVRALGDLDVFNRTVLSKSFQASSVLRDVPEWMNSIAELMEARFTDLVDLSVKGADVLDTVAVHREKLPPTIQALKNFTQSWVTNMSVGCTQGNKPIAQVHPELAGTTCWQIWNLTAESEKTTSGLGPYDGATRPTPNTAISQKAFEAQVTQLQRLTFGNTPTDLSLFLYQPLRDRNGLIPEPHL